MRVVVDVNVLVSALISQGASRQLVTAWTQERFELIASPNLLGELDEVLSREKFRRWVTAATASDFVTGLALQAEVIDDPPPQPGLTADPDDDYLLALAAAAHADFLVSGDRHLLEVSGSSPPVITARQLLELLDS